MAEENVELSIHAHDETKEGFDSAKKHVEDFGASVHETTGEVVSEMAKMVAEILAVEKALEFVKEGIEKFEEIRELKAAVEVFSTSVEEATKTWEFFDEAQKKTRQTGDELVKLYKDVLPLAIRKGLSEETTRSITVMSSNIATVLQKAPEEIMNSFKMLLSGRISNRNPLLQALGITADDIKSGKVGLDELMEKMKRVAQKGEDLGQTLESSMHKVKESLLETFAKGFAEASGSASKGVKDIVDTLTSPRVLQAVTFIGKATAYAMEIVGGAVAVVSQSIKAGFGFLETTVGSVLQHILEGAKKVIGWLDTALQFYGVGTDAASRRGVQSNMNAIDDLIAGFKGVKTAGANMMADALIGIDAVVKGEKEAGTYADGLRGKIEKGKDAFKGFGKEGDDALQKQIAAMKSMNAELDKELATTNAQLAKSQATTPVMKAWAEYQKEVAQAIGKSNIEWDKADNQFRKMAASPELDAIYTKIVGIKDAGVALANANLNAALKKAIEPGNALLKQQAEVEIEQAKAILEYMNGELLKKIKMQWRSIMSDTGLDMQNVAKSSFGAVFSDLFTSGGKNFGQIAAREFNDLVQVAAGNIGKKLQNALFGSAGDPLKGQDPNRFYNSEGKDITTQSRTLQGIGAGIGIGMNSYQAGVSGAPGSRTAGVFGGALTGASMGFEFSGGNPIGAAIGAVIGTVVSVIGGALGAAQRQADYQYGRPYINAQGTASMMFPKNLDGGDQLKQMTRQVQDKFDEFWNGYVKILMKFPDTQLIPTLKAIDGKFQDNPSAHWAEHFQQWLTNTLPDTIAGQFKEGMSKAYTSMGMSVEKFGEIWNKLGALDPQKKMQALSDLADALITFQKAEDILAPKNVKLGPWDLKGLQNESGSAWLSKLTDGDERIKTLGNHIHDLVGTDQISAAKELSQLMIDKANKEKAALLELANLATALEKSFDDAIGDRKVAAMLKDDGTPDYAKQSEYWRGIANKDLADLQLATDPAEISRLQAEYIKAVNAAADAFAKLSPDDAKLANQWAIDNLELGKHEFLKRINELGSNIATEGQKFMEEIKPFWTDFETKLSEAGKDFGTLPGDIDPVRKGMDRLNTSVTAFANAVDSATERINSATVRIQTTSSPSIQQNSYVPSYAAGVVANRGY